MGGENLTEVPILSAPSCQGYRNKAQYPIGMDKDGKVVAGFYAARTHSIISNTECFLGVPENKVILETILDYMRDNKVTAYDEETGKGLIRHVLIRKGFTSGELMVCLVINADAKSRAKAGSKASVPASRVYLPAQEKLIKKLAAICGMKSISVSINREKTNVIMGKEIHTIWGSDTITDTIHVRDMQKEGYPVTGRELTFHISPLSFYQVNPVQTEKLYSLALEYAGLTGKETVWDLYCGIGTISLFLAGNAKKVCGVEIIPQAIEDARENAVRNQITNAEFFVGKAEEVLPAFYEGKHDPDRADFLKPDVIVVDPPRKGCDEACLATMLKMQPSKIVYVSCDSATLARDLRILCDGGYTIEKVRGVDQFGQTVHVETVCLLGNRK
jgi:23S rRNA (uracil1939-C5)-methyltransferase